MTYLFRSCEVCQANQSDSHSREFYPYHQLFHNHSVCFRCKPVATSTVLNTMAANIIIRANKDWPGHNEALVNWVCSNWAEGKILSVKTGDCFIRVLVWYKATPAVLLQCFDRFEQWEEIKVFWEIYVIMHVMFLI